MGNCIIRYFPLKHCVWFTLSNGNCTGNVFKKKDLAPNQGNHLLQQQFNFVLAYENVALSF